MKKLFCLLMVCLMMSSLACAADVCPHYTVTQVQVEYGDPIAHAEGHWIPLLKYLRCNACGIVFRDPNTEYIVQGHTYFKNYENHEGISPILHVVEYICTACDYIYRIERPCDELCMVGFYSIDETCVDH